MTAAVLTRAQTNDVAALAMIAWALLDAESRDDRVGASSLVPIFVASYNAWSPAIRVWSPGAPAALNIAGTWSTQHDAALRYTLGTYASIVAGGSALDAMLDAIEAMPGGAVPNAFRGAWFGTSSALDQLHAVGHVGAWLDASVADFRRDGAAGVSEFSDAVSRGIDPTAMVPAVPAQTPSVPQQTEHPSSAQAAAFVLPHSTVLPDMLITGTAPRATEEFPVGLVLGLGTVTVLGLGLAAAAVKNRWFK